MSYNISEQTPRQHDGMEVIYNKLRMSIDPRANLIFFSEDNIPDGTISDFRTILRDFKQQKNIPKCHMTYQSYLTGKILLFLKNKKNINN